MKKQQKNEAKFDEMMANVNVDVAIPYTMTTCFQENDIVNHSKFGLGKVLSCISPNKVQILFRAEEKILIGVLNQGIE